MAGLGGVDETGRRSGGGQGRGDLAGDVSTLAHARQDDPAPGVADAVYRRNQIVPQRTVNGRNQQLQTFGFSDKCAAGGGAPLSAEWNGIQKGVGWHGTLLGNNRCRCQGHWYSASIRH